MIGFGGYLTHRLVFLHHCRRMADCAGVQGRTGAGRYLGLSRHRALPPDRIIASAQGTRRRDRGQFGLGGASATTGTFRIGRKVRWRWDGKHTSIQELRSIAANSPNLRWWRNCPLARWFGWGTSQWRSLPPTSWRCGRRWVIRCRPRNGSGVHHCIRRREMC